MSRDNFKGIDLVPASANILQENMVLPTDVYDAFAERLLVNRGVTLQASDIERINYLNKDRGTIYISDEGYRKITGKNPFPIIPNRKKVEESTGYAAIKDDTLELLDEIAKVGIDGIEVFCSYHDKETARYFYNQAIKRSLAITCGSDYHGKTKPSVKLGETGCWVEREKIAIPFCG